MLWLRDCSLARSINVGLFSGFVDVDLDNFGGAIWALMYYEKKEVEVEMKLRGGASYVADPAGNVFAAAASGLGSVARNAQKLGGRAIGYITTFRTHLQEAVTRMTGYIDNGNRLMGIVSRFGDVSGIVKRIAEEPLRRAEAFVVELLKK